MKKSLSFIAFEKDEDVNVNLTPLIDVVFVVLILFILIAPLLEIDRIQLANATSERKTDMTSFNENHQLKIHVYKDNTVWLNGMLTSMKELKSQLIQFRRANAMTHPQVFHDREACFGTYQSVKNAVEEAGFESLDVILQPGLR